MRLRSIYRHYWPDTAPYALILRAILEHRAAVGDDVRVYTAQPSYNDNAVEERPAKEALGGVAVRRFRLPHEEKRQLVRRGGNLALFLGLAGAAVATRDRPDLLLVNGHPPVGMGLLARGLARGRGVPFVYHCQDIHPEALLLGGQLSEGALYRRLKAADTRTCMRAAAVVVLSEDMRMVMLERGIPHEKVVVINNFPQDVTGDDVALHDRMANVPPDAFLVLFAGNIGNFQGLDALASAALRLRSRAEIHFVFMGAGLAEARLRDTTAALQGRTVHFVGQHTPAVARAAMARSDLGVVSLLPGIHRVAYPSKLMNYVAAGCPVLALVEEDSSVATDVRAHDLGCVCRQGDSDDIAEAIALAYADRHRWDSRERARLRGRGESCFGKTRAMKQWDELFQRLVPSASIQR